MSISVVITVLLSLFVCQSTGVDIAPPNGDCWDSTLGIITSELGGIFNATLASMERTYTMCSTVIEIGIMNTTSGLPVVEGGDFPLMIFLPNMHIRCEVVGSCIFSGGQQHLFSLPEPSLLLAFLESEELELPEDFEVDSSNLLVEGMTFTQGTTVTDELPPVSVLLSGPGQNMVMVSCLWTANQSEDFVFLLRSAVALERPENMTVPEGFEYYSSLVLLNCMFDGNRFWYAVVETFDENGGVAVDQVMQLSVLGGIISNNIISTPVGAELSSVMSLADVEGLAQDLVIRDNTMEAARSAITVLDGFMEFSSMTFQNNVIDLRLSECEDISVNFSDGNETILTRCEDDNPGVPTEPATSPPSMSLAPSTSPIVGPATLAPATSGPDTPAPATVAPATSGPDTSAPATSGPETPAPATVAPATSGPDTSAPATSVPATPAPATPAPASPAPISVSAAPVTSPPTSIAPATVAPTSSAPTTASPVSSNPSISVSSNPSIAPTTSAPVTPTQVSIAPITAAPTTLEPTSAAPVPSTPAPITPGPVDSLSPTTVAPVSPAPITLQPATLPPVDDRPSRSVVPSNVPSNSPIVGPTGRPTSSPTAQPAVTFPPASGPPIVPSPVIQSSPPVVVFPTFAPAPSAAPSEFDGMGMGMGVMGMSAKDGMEMSAKKEKKAAPDDQGVLVFTTTTRTAMAMSVKLTKRQKRRGFIIPQRGVRGL